MEKLQQNLSEIHQLSHQRAELQAKKAEMIIKEQTARPTGECPVDARRRAPQRPSLELFS